MSENSFDEATVKRIAELCKHLVLTTPRGEEGYMKLWGIDQELRKKRDPLHHAALLSSNLLLADHVAKRAKGDGLKAMLYVTYLQGLIEGFFLRYGVEPWGVPFVESVNFDKLRTMPESFSDAQYRDNLDRILDSHSLRVEQEVENRPILEVVNVVVFITKQAVEYAGRDFAALTEAEAFAAMLVSIVAADHLTRMAHLTYEVVSFVSGGALWAPTLGVEKAAELFQDAVEEFNRLAEHPEHRKVIAAIGDNITKFVSSNNTAYLCKLGEITGWLMSKSK